MSEIDRLRAENATFRHAQRACEHCDPEGHDVSVAAERERCAKLVEEMDVSGHDGYIETSGDLLVALAGCIRRGA